MRRFVLAASAVSLLIIMNACKKTDNNNSTPGAKTVQNLSGSYSLTNLTASFLGASTSLYDSLPPCDKDNIIQLNANMTAQFIDAGIVCVPPSDSTGTWSLSSNSDTLNVAGSAGFIQSWDGKTLVLTSDETISGIPVVATTTLVKK